MNKSKLQATKILVGKIFDILIEEDPMPVTLAILTDAMLEKEKVAKERMASFDRELEILKKQKGWKD